MALRLPKLYLVRHGETEWTINVHNVALKSSAGPQVHGTINASYEGRHTGTTDIPLTANGESMIQRLGEKVIGQGKLIDPQSLSAVLVSPRSRAQKTFELLFTSSEVKPAFQTDRRVREWTYGDYEGLHIHEIVDMRNARGIANGEKGWDIWVDGCEGGESTAEMTARVDEVVKYVKELHYSWLKESNREKNDKGGDVLIVSHGHFSRCLLARWLELPLEKGQLFSLDPGGVCVMQYYHDLQHTSIGSMNVGLL